jgi:hypothetical protein
MDTAVGLAPEILPKGIKWPKWDYTPLDESNEEIRILTIEPGPIALGKTGRFRVLGDEPEHALNIFLQVVSLKSSPPPRYKALSYTWADQACDEEIGESKLPQWNLAAALVHLRDAKERVVLWADAICINQDDLAERGQQVALMAKIYHSAEEVIAWVGPDWTRCVTHESELDWIRQWADQIRRIETTIVDTQDMQVRAPQNNAFLRDMQQAFPTAFDRHIYGHASTVMTRKYWTRAWVFQELVFGGRVTIRWGLQALDMRDFVAAVEGWTRHEFLFIWPATGFPGPDRAAMRNMRYYPVATMLQVAKILRGECEAAGGALRRLLPRYLMEFSAFRASDPRDKIFALQGLLATDAPYRELLRPDYTKSAEEIYTNATRYLILTGNDLSVLGLRHCPSLQGYLSFWKGHVKDSPRKTLDLPSWVVDWQDRIIGDVEPEQPEHLWQWGLDKVVDFSNNGRTLLAKGFDLDVIDEVFGWGIFPLKNDTAAFQQFVDKILVPAETEPPGENNPLLTWMRTWSSKTLLNLTLKLLKSPCRK